MKNTCASKAGLLTAMFALLPQSVQAHCPLCTAGAAMAVGGAAVLGVKEPIIGLFLGAFAASTGLWMSRWRRSFIQKKHVFVLISWLTTVLPVLPFTSNYPLYISLAGGYGTWLNRTYVLKPVLFASILGALIVIIAPKISAQVSNLRRQTLPYQGISLTFGMLFMIAALMQVFV